MDASAFDIFILVMRVAFIFLLYFFLFLVVRVIVREFNFASRRRAQPISRDSAAYAPEEPYYGPSTGMPGRLVVMEVGTATTVRPGVVFELKPVMPIGRRSDMAIILNDEFVSNEHSLIAFRDGRWWLSDVASTNGTYLNGERLNQPRPLQPGDVVGIGRVKLRLET